MANRKKRPTTQFLDRAGPSQPPRRVITGHSVSILPSGRIGGRAFQVETSHNSTENAALPEDHDGGAGSPESGEDRMDVDEGAGEFESSDGGDVDRGLEDGNDDLGLGEEEDGEAQAEEGAKRKTETMKDRILRILPHRDEYLDELNRLDGLADAFDQGACFRCGIADALHRCSSCATGLHWCEACLVQSHSINPLHRIEMWSGESHRKTWLSDIGLVYQLGHGGAECPCPDPVPSLLTVVDITGIHRLQVRYCACLANDPAADHRGVLHHRVQILRARWYPATTDRPQTAFTFRVLDLFLELNTRAKINLNDFYDSLENLTDKTRPSSAHRYKQMSLAVRFWRHLHALKRAGRGHDPAGVAATTPGSLAIECPACPQPGRNLPNGWENSPADTLWMYFLFLMVDANFRLRCKERGLDDVELGSGWSLFVEENAYLQHVADFADQRQENTCGVEHNAILNANLRKDGYVASGVGAVLCARHALVRPSGMGDLQKGEKYCNMDFLLLSTLSALMFLFVLVSYDIACQFSKNFVSRMESYPPSLHREFDELRWAIPKKHIQVHGRNHSRWSFNFLRWVARTYGEGVEVGWHYNNPLSGQTSEMATGVRHEVLDDNFNAWNLMKILAFGTRFAAALILALQQAQKQRDNFEKHNALYDKEHTDKWREILGNWYNDPNSKPDPFEEPATGFSVKEMLKKLAAEDARALQQGILPAHETSPSSFIQVGLELEEQQRDLAAEIAVHGDVDDDLSVTQKRIALAKRIQGWRLIQDVYVPHAAALRDLTLESESANLLLPSSLPLSGAGSATVKQLATIEAKLRLAQLDDALSDLRHWRRTLVKVTDFKNKNVRGTGNKPNTRSRAVYIRFNGKAKLAVERYRAARIHLLALDPDGDWKDKYQVLRDEDNRGPGADPEDMVGVQRNRYQRRGDGFHQPSWIWLTASETPDDPNSDAYSASMRVDWSKYLARAERWEEEVLLLQEEMRRVIVFLRWKGSWWRSQVNRRQHQATMTRILLSGLNAYAYKQAHVWEQLAARFVVLWYAIMPNEEIRQQWKEWYPDGVVESEQQKKKKGKQKQKE
ncbi:hypothetical protein EIP91_011272 [Steccherinum ochraceum]|uniref:CxC2-like cysteine cluster KDZ transposase-associated domain-containing protein n=1 Tax=Steccherinum ochraceum TaxID=92696 RepID=A0A4R0QZT9_9APHY|nr:hypothetical protein EIP91_011272 [Steccherinum ochraceum]